jgi:hypothetical protein
MEAARHAGGLAAGRPTDLTGSRHVNLSVTTLILRDKNATANAAHCVQGSVVGGVVVGSRTAWAAWRQILGTNGWGLTYHRTAIL